MYWMRLKNFMTLFNCVFFAFVLLNLAGCGSVKYTQIKEIDISKETIKIQEPQEKLRVGEALTYEANWTGIPVATLATRIEGIENINGFLCYHVVVTVKSNRWLSTFYRIDDEFHSYIDTEKLFTRRLIKKQKEGRFESDEIIDFDHNRQKAIYKSLKNNTVKEFDIPALVQDEVSSFYYYRLKKKDASEPLKFFLNLNEKNYSIETKIIQVGIVQIEELGEWKVVVVQPAVGLDGEVITKARVLVWVSTDSERLPLIIKTKTPIVGTVNLLLKEKK